MGIVPISKIISRYQKALANVCSIAIEVDRLYIYDNSIEDSDAKLLFRESNGKVMKVYDNINEWAKPILKEINK